MSGFINALHRKLITPGNCLQKFNGDALARTRCATHD